MATLLTLEQDNIIGDNDLLPIHQPLVFEVRATSDFFPISGMTAQVFLLNPVSINKGTFKMIEIDRGTSEFIQHFIFIADSIIKGNMRGGFDDDLIDEEQITEVNDSTSTGTPNPMIDQFRIEFFITETPSTNTSITASFIHAVRQMGDFPNLIEVSENNAMTYYAPENKWCYVYFYSKDAGNILDVEGVTGGILSKTTKENTLYRIKVPVTNSNKSIHFYIAGSLVVTHTIKVLQGCENGLMIKYLDKNAQYRFISFNEYYQTYDKPVKIGATEEIVTNIYDNQTDSKNIGYKNERNLKVRTEANTEQLLEWSQIYTSPRVYLYKGDTGDEKQDWLEVEIKSNDNIVRRRKNKTGAFEMTIKLPKHYSITMI